MAFNEDGVKYLQDQDGNIIAVEEISLQEQLESKLPAGTILAED